MTIAIIILGCIVVGLSIALAAVLYSIARQNKLNQFEQTSHKQIIENYKNEISKLQKHKSEIQLKLDCLNKLFSRQYEEYSAANEVAKQQLNTQREELIKILNNLNAQIQDKQFELSAILIQLVDKRQDVEIATEQWNELNKSILEYENLIKALSGEINQLKQTKLAATKHLDNEASGRIMEWADSDKYLTEVLVQLSTTYPMLADALAQVAWTKIWQPKFQAMTADIIKTKPCGIYRIWNDSTPEKCYIGQARDIRERWSQHIKKMLGVLVRDNSKLYKYIQPWNAHFEIIEECVESKLNEQEHYWIEYFNSVQNGYNSKI